MKKFIIAFFIAFTAILSAQDGRYGKVVISEVYYDTPLNEIPGPRTPHSVGEFIELFNSSNVDIDISEWTLLRQGIKYTIPNSTIIKAGGFKVISFGGSTLPGIGVDEFFVLLFPEVTKPQVHADGLLQSSFALDNNVDLITLHTDKLIYVDHIGYIKTGYPLPSWWPSSQSPDFTSDIDNGSSMGTTIGPIPDTYKYSVNIINRDGFYTSGARDYTQNPYDPRIEDPVDLEPRQFGARIATPYSLSIHVPLLDPDPGLIDLPDASFSTTENYIAEIDHLRAINVGGTAYNAVNKKMNVTYLDDLGKKKQSVAIGQSNELKDIIAHFEYDNIGREVKSYLPVANNNYQGQFDTNAKSLTEAYYINKYGQQNYFAEKKYANSTSNSIQEKGAPGDSWKITDNLANTNTDAEKSFPFTVHPSTYFDGNYNIYKSFYSAHIVDDVLYVEGAFVFDNPGQLSFTSYSRAISSWLGVSISGNHDLGYVLNEDFENTPFKIKIDNGNILIEGTGGSYTSRKFIFSFSITLHDHKVNSDHTFKNEITTNDDLEVKLFKVDNSGSYPQIVEDGYYKANELNKIINKDANWNENQPDLNNNTTVEYKNKLDQTILKIAYNNGPHETYYVYNEFENLTFVIPPKVNVTNGVSLEELNALCYQYKYDHKKRLVEKRLPGRAGWDAVVFDKLDRPVLSQDPNLRVQNKWLFSKYDKYGRVVYTGIYNNVNDRVYLQGVLDARTESQLHESRSTVNVSIDGILLGYNNNAFPTDLQNIDVLTVNYYDDYSYNFEGTSVPNLNVYGENLRTDVKVLGQATGAKVRILGTESWIINIPFYKQERSQYRKVFTISNNEYLNATEKESIVYDYDGTIFQTTKNHTKGVSSIELKDTFIYDHAKRITHHFQQINDNDYELITHNKYDELGVLSEKHVGRANISGYNKTGNITISNNTITKSGGSIGWNEGVSTKARFVGDGSVSYMVPRTDKPIMVGLSDVDTNAFYTSIDYALYTRHDGYVYIYEGGTPPSGTWQITDYEAGDIFKVERVGTTVSYKKNGETFYTSTVPSMAHSLLADVSMYSVGAVIHDLKVKGNLEGLQKVDHEYNIRGWLTSINEDTDTRDNDLFNFSIKYDNPVSGTPLYNGNISQTNWNSLSLNPSGNPISNTYTYSYDALSRITDAFDNTGYYNVQNISYDENGNILSLKRGGHTDVSATSFGTMDDLTYSYDDGNRLLKVADNAPLDQFGFKDDAENMAPDDLNDYTYDSNGNMLRDYNKDITTDIIYNHLNLPEEIKINGSNANKVNFMYDALGKKISKIVVNNIGGTSTIEYVNNVIYDNDVLKFISQPEGYIEIESGTSFKYVFQYRDHTKNVRLSYADLNKDGVIKPDEEILHERNYYPFGLEHLGYHNTIIGVSNNYGTFQGQELNTSLELNIHEWKYRVSDPAIGRFWQIDPLSDSYVYNSTYAFAENRLGLGWELEGAESHIRWLLNEAARNPDGVAASTVGFIQGAVVDPVIDIWNLATDDAWKSKTWKGLGNMLLASGMQGNIASMYSFDQKFGTNTYGAYAGLGMAIDQGIDTWQNGTNYDRSKIVGNIFGSIVGTKGVNNFVKGTSFSSKISKYTFAFSKHNPLIKQSTALVDYYPPNAGAMGDWVDLILKPGTKIDRFGGLGGKYFSPLGVEKLKRALPPGNSGTLNQFEVLVPFKVRQSIIAPAFGQVGTGIQYYSPFLNASDLLDGGFIKYLNGF